MMAEGIPVKTNLLRLLLRGVAIEFLAIQVNISITQTLIGKNHYLACGKSVLHVGPHLHVSLYIQLGLMKGTSTEIRDFYSVA